MKRLLISAAALTLLGAPAAFAQQDQNQHDRGQWQGRSGGQQQQQQQQQQTQSGGAQQGASPDWNAYYRNNPDLQRAYKQNQQSSTYHESVDAFAQRHYQEHGKTEGRALPTAQGGGQGQAQSHPGMRYDQSSGWIPVQPQGQSQQGRGTDNRYQDQRRGQGGGDNRYNGDNRYTGDNRYNGDRNRTRDNRWQRYERNTFAQRRFRLGEYRWPRGFSYRRWTYGEFLPSIFFGENYWLYDYNDYGLGYPPPGTAWVRYGPDALLIDRYSGQIIEVVYGVFY